MSENYRMKNLKNEDSMEEELRQKIYDKYNGHCAYCGKELTFEQMQVDHIEPIFRNDTDEQIKDMGRIRV